MALITNNISGSANNSSLVGVTGSVIIANRPAASFPGMPGTDTVFFVSGSAGNNSDVSVFGGDLVVSGGFFVGGETIEITGSLYVTGSLELDGTFEVTGDTVEITGSMYVTGSLELDGNFQVTGDLFEITGTLIVTEGLSGSLTKLPDGTSYLIEGNNVTIVSNSNGSVTISSTGGGGDSFFSSTTAGSIFTTGSAAFRGQESIDSPSDKGTDVFFYVSGSTGAVSNEKSLFGGDVVVSGSLVASGDRLEMSGTLSVTEGISGSLTKLTDGTSYLVEGNNISIVSQSNGSILISGSDSFFSSTTAGSIFTTGSAAFRGQESIASPADKGTDVFFYVSGSLDGNDKALFGGDLVVSGTLKSSNNAIITGSLSVSGSYSGNINTMSGGGTIESTGHSMLITATGIGDSITLNDGTLEGQIKYIAGVSGYTGGNTSIITPTNALGFTTVTFDANGDAATFFWTGTKWIITGFSGASIV